MSADETKSLGVLITHFWSKKIVRHYVHPQPPLMSSSHDARARDSRSTLPRINCIRTLGAVATTLILRQITLNFSLVTLLLSRFRDVKCMGLLRLSSSFYLLSNGSFNK